MGRWRKQPGRCGCCCAGQPNSSHTLEFLQHLLQVAAGKAKKVLVIVWDNASWHKSQQVRQWVQGHNWKVKREGGVRLLTYLLPKRSPWLNAQEPHWVHGKKQVVQPAGSLTAGELKERIRDYFHADAPLD
jgi:hypothetical protein